MRTDPAADFDMTEAITVAAWTKTFGAGPIVAKGEAHGSVPPFTDEELSLVAPQPAVIAMGFPPFMPPPVNVSRFDERFRFP